MSFILSAFADEISPNLDEQMRVCAAHGVRFIEMRGVDGKNISDVTEKEAYEIRRRLDGNGFGVSSLGTPYGKISLKDDFEVHLEKFKRTVEVAYILGAARMRIFSFYDAGDKDFESVFDRIGQFVENSDGVTLCHENEKGIYGETPKRCRRLFDEFEGRLRLIFDPANYVQCNADVKQAYEITGAENTDYLHIKDALYETGTVVPAGRGAGKLRWLVNKFYEDLNGGTAFLSLEPHLKVFDGFGGLEQGGALPEGNYRSGEEAFHAAALALKLLLVESDFDCKNTGGYEKWRKK